MFLGKRSPPQENKLSCIFWDPGPVFEDADGEEEPMDSGAEFWEGFSPSDLEEPTEDEFLTELTEDSCADLVEASEGKASNEDLDEFLSGVQAKEEPNKDELELPKQAEGEEPSNQPEDKPQDDGPKPGGPNDDRPNDDGPADDGRREDEPHINDGPNDDGPPYDPDINPVLRPEDLGRPVSNCRWGCARCRWGKGGCTTCREWASRGHRGYHVDLDGHIAHGGR